MRLNFRLVGYICSGPLAGSISSTILHRDADHHREVDQKRDYAVLTISNPISNQIGSDFGNIL